MQEAQVPQTQHKPRHYADDKLRRTLPRQYILRRCLKACNYMACKNDMFFVVVFFSDMYIIVLSVFLFGDIHFVINVRRRVINVRKKSFFVCVV